MRALLLLAVKFLALFFVLSAPTMPVMAADDSRVTGLLNEIDDMWRGRSSHAITTMQVKTAHYTRTMKLEGWSEGKEKTLFRIIEPLREKGTATLKSGENVYTYLPKTDRTIKLTSSMMMGSWMGSHLTNDDLVKEARLVDDYNASISFEGKRNGQNVIEFNLLPKPEAAVVWGKIILTINADSHNPMVELYYDEDMKLARTITFSDLKMLAGRMRPSVLRVVPADKPGEYTEFRYDSLELDISLPPHLFSLANLKRY